MDFLKKIFGRKDEGEESHDHGTFRCESCGENRDEAQRKVSAPEKGPEEKKNVCEYC